MKQRYTEPDVLVIYPKIEEDVFTLSTEATAQQGESVRWNTDIFF